MRAALVESFPAVLTDFDDLDASDALELLGKAPTPGEARRLTVPQISAALQRARRRRDLAGEGPGDPGGVPGRAAPRPPGHRGRPRRGRRAQAGLIGTLNADISRHGKQVDAHFGQHPNAEILLSQPGLGPVLVAGVLAEFGDDPTRYADAKSRKNYAGTSPIIRASGKKTVVMAAAPATTGSPPLSTGRRSVP